MAVTSRIFGQTLLKAMNKEIKWNPIGGDTFKVALYTGAIPATAQDSWVYKSDINTIVEVANGNGYTTDGATLTVIAPSYDSTNNIIKFDANDIVWSNSTISSTCALIIDDTGMASSSVLIGYIDFGGTMSSSNGNFTITFDSQGVFTISTT